MLAGMRDACCLARFIAQEGARCIAAASDWRTPTLLLYAGSDALVSPNGSRAFAANVQAHYVKAQCFDPMYHEIFNDTEREQVFAAALSWLDHQRKVPALASGV